MTCKSLDQLTAALQDVLYILVICLRIQTSSIPSLNLSSVLSSLKANDGPPRVSTLDHNPSILIHLHSATD